MITASYQGQATVRWVLDNGSPDVTATEDLGTSVVSSKPADPVKSGFRFTGWTYETGDSEAELSSLTDDMVITASYVQQITVTWNNEDGTLITSITKDFGSDVSSSVPADRTKTGYHFTGWSYETGDSEAELSSLTDDMIITAAFQINTFTVKFVDYNGTVLSTQTVEYGKAASAPSEPDRGGYRFVQWSVSFDNVTSDLTVTPVYVDISGGTTAAAAAIAPAAAPAAPAPAPTTTVIPETSAPAAAPSASASSSASPGTETETITGEQTPEAAPGGEGIPAWVWALIGVGAAGFLFWLFFWLKKKRKEEEEQGNH